MIDVSALIVKTGVDLGILLCEAVSGLTLFLGSNSYINRRGVLFLEEKWLDMIDDCSCRMFKFVIVSIGVSAMILGLFSAVEYLVVTRHRQGAHHAKH